MAFTTDCLSRLAAEPSLKAFLAERYEHFLILDFFKTTIGNISEVDEFSVLLVKIEDMPKFHSYTRFVKPTILKRLSENTIHRRAQYNPDFKPKEESFSQVLRDVLTLVRLVASEEKTLILVENDHLMREFYSQCEVEKAMNAWQFPPDEDMRFFDRWCSLDSLYYISRSVLNEQDRKTLSKTYWASRIKSFRQPCIAILQANLNVISLYQETLRADLFPTTIVERLSGDYSTEPISRNIDLTLLPKLDYTILEPPHPDLEDDDCISVTSSTSSFDNNCESGCDCEDCMDFKDDGYISFDANYESECESEDEDQHSIS